MEKAERGVLREWAVNVTQPQTLRQLTNVGYLTWGLEILKDLLQYRKAKAKCVSGTEEFRSLFKRFLDFSTGRTCLRLKFDAENETDLGLNWLTMSLDPVERKARDAGGVSIEIESEYFDAVFCSGLERVSHPGSLVAEVRRLLKDGGQLWVQAPLSGPYLARDSISEYWRFTPEGLHVLLQDFDEILCSVYSPGESALRTCSYFYGLKPMRSAEALAGLDPDTSRRPANLACFVSCPSGGTRHEIVTSWP